jgi:hypothetical protein
MLRVVKLAIVAACTIGIALGSAGTSAKAATATPGVSASVSQTTAVGVATGTVYWTTQSESIDLSIKTSSTYAYATFYADYTGFTMDAWIERSTDGGQSWSTVSSVHAMGSDDFVSTYAYYDGPGYLARACFKFTSWSGAADHCSAWI